MTGKEIEPLSGKELTKKPKPLQAGCKKVLFKLFTDLRHGRLTINNCGTLYDFGEEQGAISASISIHDPQFYFDVLFMGSLGAAESFMKGHWSTDNLTDVVRLFVVNTDLLNRRLDGGWSRLTAPFRRLFHLLHKNTPRGSRKNIGAHYDLSNDFFRLFLDRSMAYSCGIFERPASSLHEAQIAKFDRLCKKLELGADDHLLEIGGGWGGFALHAAKNYGCRVTTTTISKEQYRHMGRLFQKAGLTNRITLLQKDYRQLSGKFDKLVSIEMIEAVGHHYLDSFFECCCRLLKADGLMSLQAITLPDREFERHTRSVDFIKRYIFPGCCIPSVAAISKSIAAKTDLRLIHFEDITPHYAVTLRHWRQRFLANEERVRSMGFSKKFIRMWEFYLASCEGSFEEHYNGDVQMLFARPAFRRSRVLPPLAH